MLKSATYKADTTLSGNIGSMTYNGKTMRYYVTTKGSKPSDGYPLYIALHGGGGTSASTNDSQWEHMKTYYSNALGVGVYVACRGVEDTWNTHFVDESYVLYDRLIQNMILKYDVNPNKVYIMGYSAGGDGVYAVTPRMADRFAGANMSAGHPNGVSVLNLKNVAFMLQVGEKDTSYKRHLWTARYDAILNALQSKYGGYTHTTRIHEGKPHNFNDTTNGSVDNIISNPQTWLTAQQNGGTYSGGSSSPNCFPPTWLNGYTRNPLPTSLVWDLGTRANMRSVESFYWLSAPKTVTQGTISATYSKSDNLIVLKTEDIQTASYNESQKKVIWSTPTAASDFDFAVLLNEEMVDFSKAVTFEVDGKRVTGFLQPDRSVLEATTNERGDPNYQFEARVSYSDLKRYMEHDLKLIPAKAATATANGNSAYYQCALCGKYFSDANGTTEIEENSWVVLKHTHSWNVPTYTWSDDYHTCTAERVCDFDGCCTSESETVRIVALVRKANASPNSGQATFYMTFKNPAFETQVKTVKLNP